MPFEDFRQQMKDTMLTQRVISQEVSSKIPIKHEEVEKYYNEHKSEFIREERLFLREILISTENKDAAGAAAAEKKANDLVARARRGERFAEMARDNSDAVHRQQHGRTSVLIRKVTSPRTSKTWSGISPRVTSPIRSSCPTAFSSCASRSTRRPARPSSPKSRTK